MKSNNIKIKFASEQHFEKFPFNSETITYQEVILYLERKKKIDIQKKADLVILHNIDENNEVVTAEQKIIHAGSRLVVVRKPELPAKTDTMELTYIPKHTERSKTVLERATDHKDAQDNQALNEQKQAEEVDKDSDNDSDANTHQPVAID